MPTLHKDDLFQAQLLRAVGYAPYGGADIGECLAVADRVTGADLSLWHAQWLELAERTEAAALASEQSGQLISARSQFFRASNYFRTAGVFLLSAPVSPELLTSHRREVAAFRRGAALLDIPAEAVEIPYGDTTLPAYFFRASSGDEPQPTVVLTNGYDGTAEELYFSSGAAALARGYHVLAFDGPGQGTMLLDRNVALRPDWEAVITPVVDWLLVRPEVDPARVALIGLSLGGYLAPRAASVEHRLAACICDCGPYDVFDVAAARLPGFLARALPDGNPRLLRLLGRVLNAVMRKPTAGWALRRNLLVHNVRTPLEYFQIANEYSLKGREASITCPTFVCTTDRDDLSAAAPRLYEALTCTKTFVEFTAAAGAGEHCESGGRSAFHEAAFDWLASVLAAR